ncbi:MAG: hypothetical protein R2850_09595 [Bacteroidia bacterium]
MRDTVVNGIYYDSILVNSVNPDSAYFRATFASVGSGNGDYIQSSAANGRVFSGSAGEWCSAGQFRAGY